MLLALDRYFHTYEKATPDFVARAWLGERYAGEHAFRGRTTERQPSTIPMADARGKGRARATSCSPRRARAGSTTGSACATRRDSLDLDAARPRLHRGARLRGASTTRATSARAADGTWHIRAGARVRVRLTMVAPDAALSRRARRSAAGGPRAAEPGARRDRHHAGDGGSDVTPIGAPASAARGGPGTGGGGRGPGSSTRTCATSASRPSPRCCGRASTATATSPAPRRPARSSSRPRKAEEMYAPETFGRGATDRVIVE